MNEAMTGMRAYLESKGIIGTDVVPYFPSTRDRADLAVYMCRDSEVLFLDRPAEGLENYYTGKSVENDGKTSKSKAGGTTISTATLQDSQRRFADFRDLIANKKVCDFGTGHGLFMRAAKDTASEIAGVELNAIHVAKLKQEGFRVEDSILAYEAQQFDVVTLFHVLEHLAKPVEMLADIRSRMKPGARLVIEVPHARDFLHRTLESEPFKKFTFWSEHLVLHTANSLRQTLALGGFSNITVKGYQRYGLENHLHWLVKQKPGGHEAWGHLADERLKQSYAVLLQSIGQTDTLLAFASA